MHATHVLLAATTLTLLGAGQPAHATTGLEWQWGADEVRRYRVKADIQLPNAIIFMADNNREARVFDTVMALDLSCKPAHVGKASLDVACDVSAAQFYASAEPQDFGRLQLILDEWDEKLVNDATITFVLDTDGQVKNVDIQGLNERIQRIRLVKETMRLFVVRMVAAFDLNLPRKGDDTGVPWKQKSPLALQLPVITGMAGSVKIDSTVTGAEGSVVTIDTVGRGALSVEPQVSGPGDTRPPDIYDVDMRSRATFDTATGNLLSRSYVAQGMLTPGSSGAIGREVAPYVQAVELVFVPDGTPMTTLGPNKETTPR